MAKKVKNIQLPMKFNPGLERYEPELPIIRRGKRPEIKSNSFWIIFMLLVIITLAFVYFLLSNLA